MDKILIVLYFFLIDFCHTRVIGFKKLGNYCEFEACEVDLIILLN
jgi:hypothetical protein